MSNKGLYAVIVLLATAVAVLVVVNRGHAEAPPTLRQGPPAQSHARKEKLRNFDAQIVANANELLEEGRATFRFDTFGDEAFWGGQLQLHQAIKGAAMNAALSATNGERICACWPNAPMNERLDNTTEMASAPTPTGLMS